MDLPFPIITMVMQLLDSPSQGINAPKIYLIIGIFCFKIVSDICSVKTNFNESRYSK